MKGNYKNACKYYKTNILIKNKNIIQFYLKHKNKNKN